MDIDSIINVQLICSDIRETKSDVLILKYAQNFYGVDSIISQELLMRKGIDEKNIRPGIGEFAYIDKAYNNHKKILFVGVNKLLFFSYKEIKNFAYNSLSFLKSDLTIKTVAFTIHGAGYGLDENVSILNQFWGIIKSIRDCQYPFNLEKIFIVENNYQRFCQLKNTLEREFAEYKTDTGIFSFQKKNTVSYKASNSFFLPDKSIFVAMPFDPKYDDLYYFGIQNVVSNNKYLCERVDQQFFLGDILKTIITKIEQSILLIADLSTGNPNVYLEVGYAWGIKKPTLLIVNKNEELKFDVQNQNCIQYSSIKDLNKKLTNAIETLKKQKII